MRIHYFQHVPFEGLGIIQPWAELRGHTLNVTQFFRGDKPPKIEDIDWLIIMGGSMGVYDEKIHTWLGEEKKFIAQAIQQQRTVLGICLGAQLIASALGAKVYSNAEKEIGWYPIQLTADGKKSKFFQNFPGHFTAFHWHGDTFDLPKGARWLAESEACKHQAFSLSNNVLGLQFHLEVARENVVLLIKNCGHQLYNAPFIQAADQMLSQDNYFKEMDKKMIQILEQCEKY
jgi:GMP synthase (glutamine-hydrolysing)